MEFVVFAISVWNVQQFWARERENQQKISHTLTGSFRTVSSLQEQQFLEATFFVMALMDIATPIRMVHKRKKNFYDNEVIVINMYRIVFRPEFLWNNFFLLERRAAALELSTWTLKFELPVLGSAKLVVLDG